MMKDLKKLQGIDVIEGSEETKISQIFHPYNIRSYVSTIRHSATLDLK